MGMVWLAKRNALFSALSGPSHFPSIALAGSCASDLDVLDCGSLIIETTIDQAKPAQSPLLDCKIAGAADSQFTLTVDRNGNTSVYHQVGGTISRLNLAGDATQTQLRITFSWNVPKNMALLSVEAPQNGYLCQAETNAPLPMPLEIIDTLLTQRPPAHISTDITFLGVSRQVEPVGFVPSIAKQSLIETPIGHLPIEELRRGDLVTTLDNGPQPIRWICERRVPTRGLFQPFRLRAPYFGLHQDILVAPEQRLFFESTEIEYLFGTESVLVEARHLANNVNVIHEPALIDSIHLYQLLFDNHEIITVSGCQMESLFVGKIADNPEVLKSTLLANLPPSECPYHTNLARPLLRSYEAMALQKS